MKTEINAKIVSGKNGKSMHCLSKNLFHGRSEKKQGGAVCSHSLTHTPLLSLPLSLSLSLFSTLSTPFPLFLFNAFLLTIYNSINYCNIV